MKRLAVFIVALFCAAAFAQDLPKIAVYVTGNVPDDEKKALGTRMLATLINSGRYTGIERSNSFLAEIEKEQVRQRSGAIDDSQISELGRQFGVKFVCIADITPAFGEYQVSARIINVETAVVAFIGESFSPLKSSADLVAVSNQVVRNMFGEQAAPAAAYTVAVTINPHGAGSVSRSLDKATYESGDVLTLTAVANSGYAFAGWSGASNSANPVLTGPITGDLALTANFQPAQPAYTLAATVSPQGGGAVTRSPDKETYAAGETVSVSAAPAAGYKFTGWSGAVTGRKNHATVTMDGDKALTANFYLKSIPPPDAPKPAAKPKPEPREGGGLTKMLRVGGGLSYAGDLAGGLQWGGGAGILAMPYNAYGAYLFLDAEYAALSIGYSAGGGMWETPNEVDPGDLPYMSFTAISVGVYAKYPNLINISVPVAGADRAVRIYPLVGIDYELPNTAALEYENDNPDIYFDGLNRYGYAADALAAVWVRLGAGADVYLTDNAFVRVELSYGARMPNWFEIDQAERNGAESTRQGQGAAFKIGAGFKL